MLHHYQGAIKAMEEYANLKLTQQQSANAELKKQNEELVELLSQLLFAVTSKGATDTRNPIMWSGSPVQNRAMFKAIEDTKNYFQNTPPKN